MSDLNLELLSRYADGEVSADETRQVEALVASDAEAAQALREFQDLAGLFGHGDPDPISDPISDALAERLYRVRPVPVLEAFTKVEVEPRRRSRWLHRVAAVAALVLVAFGIQQFMYRPKVDVNSFVRQSFDASGRVTSTSRQASMTMRAGDTLETGPFERISCRVGGAMVVLLERSRLTLGDPRDLEIVEVEQGTALCTLARKDGEQSLVRAGDYMIRTERADFGVRVHAPGARSAGPSLAPDVAEVTVAVSRGSCEIGRNGDRQELAAGHLVVWRDGRQAQDSPAWEDPLYNQLLSTFQSWGGEVIPGYFSTEQGVTPIGRHGWDDLEDGGRVLVVTPAQSAARAHYLVLYLKATEPTPFTLTRVLPYRDTPGTAQITTVQTAVVGTDWTVVAVRRDAFDAGGAARKDRKIPAGFSRYARLELRPAAEGVTFTLKSSLWAARPPTTKSSKVVR